MITINTRVGPEKPDEKQASQIGPYVPLKSKFLMSDVFSLFFGRKTAEAGDSHNITDLRPIYEEE